MRRKTVAIIIMCVIVAGIFFFIKSNNIRDTEMPSVATTEPDGYSDGALEIT